jgi:hypothetical protein
MDYFAGLDISMDETHVCIVEREGEVVHASKTASTGKRSPLSWRKRQVVAGSYSKQVEWPQSCSTGSAAWVFP